MHLRSIFVLFAILVHAAPAAAQQKPAADAPEAPATAMAPSVTEPGTRVDEIRIDGRIEESAWLAAPLVTGFVASEPEEGAPAGQPTEVRLLFDEDAIWVAARMFEPDPDDVRGLLLRRDERGAFFDWFGVSIDPNHDRRTGYAFRVNAAGVQQDLYMFDDSGEDTNWNAVWESAVSRDAQGWSVEMRIPLSQIRYESSQGPQTWGINFHRRRVAAGELSHFSLESRRRSGLVSQFGTLENVRVPSSIQRVEARPYVLSSLRRGPAEPGDPFFDGSEVAGRVGSDFRVGLGSSFTLDATVNPDFGQVEADPAEINLTAFETFFDEQRPFFVEDGQIFDFRLSGGRNQLFYSRRIGREPHGDTPTGAAAAEIPDAATILGAAKVTGRTSGGLSVGALAALTQAESGQAAFPGDPDLRPFAVEPRTEYGAVSAFQDLNDGMTQVGGILTVLHRHLPGSGEFDGLTREAYSTGVRFDHLWDDRQWRLNGFLAGSHVRGAPEALLAIQRSSNHYFQRPDATRADVDSAATAMSGAEWRLQLDRQNTEHWTGAVWLAQVTRGFEINDLGFSGSRERLDGGFRLGYREIRPGRYFREYNVNFNNFHNFSHEALDDVGSAGSWQNAYTNGSFNLGGSVTFLNFHAINGNVSYRPDRYSRTATRGGPIMIEPGGIGWRLGVNSDRRSMLSLNAGINYERGARDNGSDFSVDGGISVRPSSAVSLQLRPRFSVQSDRAQYVTQTSAVTYAPTFGRRYFFADIDRKTVSLETRANYTFSPTLTFQLFAQGLLSSGDYVRYKQLERPSSFAFHPQAAGYAGRVNGTVVCAGGTICELDGVQHLDLDGDGTSDFSFRDRDFNVRSLIGNAVLRWEYRPGSTVFLVWQRQQNTSVNLGDFDFARDLDALWGIPADNRFIVKMNWWLG